ncbi:MAG: 5'-3' exonuclease, partial [Opitutales bacterium]|nr:5'-3' exonuclease [Opitutales bacterium]
MNYYLIDGYNMAFRSFYAMPELTRSDGFPTGALHAFFAGI